MHWRLTIFRRTDTDLRWIANELERKRTGQTGQRRAGYETTEDSCYRGSVSKLCQPVTASRQFSSCGPPREVVRLRQSTDPRHRSFGGPYDQLPARDPCDSW